MSGGKRVIAIVGGGQSGLQLGNGVHEGGQPVEGPVLVEPVEQHGQRGTLRRAESGQ